MKKTTVYFHDADLDRIKWIKAHSNLSGVSATCRVGLIMLEAALKNEDIARVINSENVKRKGGKMTKVDTRTQSAMSIGAEMWAAAGDTSITQAIKAYGSVLDAAKVVVELMNDKRESWIDFDGDVLDVQYYVLLYITNNW